MITTRLLLVLLVLIAQTTKGQVYFEGLYGEATSSQAIGIGGTVSVLDGYLSWAYSYGNYAPYLFRVDYDGNLTHELFMPQPDTINRIAYNVVVVSDTTFVGLVLVSVLTQPDSVRGDFGLVKFQGNGEVIWEHLYGMPDRSETPQRVIQTSDGGFAMIGQAIIGTGSSERGDVYLIQTDANGEQLWERTYGGSQYDAGLDLVQTPDEGYLLLGWTYSYGAGQRDFYLIKTDSIGNQQWQRTYGGGGDEIGKNILRLDDGSYLLTGSGSQPSGSGSQGMKFKISASGQVIWERTYIYAGNSTNEFQKTVEAWNADLITTGLTGNLSNSGWLVRTDTLGELIWQREFDKNEFTDLFYSVLATNDGGYLLSGFARNTETNSPDAWLLKVDSVGCTYADCLVGVDETEPTKVMVDVWPNPATDFLNVEIVGNSTYLDLQVFDISGREILRFTQYDRQATIDTGHWNSGIYILKGTDESGRGFNVKVVKQ